MLVPRMTADIGGKKTSRVRVRRKAKSTGTAKAGYKKSPETRGYDYAVIAVSIPVAELAILDEWCARVQMARSHFLRAAAKHFAGMVL